MSYAILYDTLAEDDVKEIIDWYSRISLALTTRFLSKLKLAETRIQKNPYGFVKVGKSSFRRALIDKFPYCVYFKPSDNEVFILAVIHFTRSDRYRKLRLKK